MNGPIDEHAVDPTTTTPIASKYSLMGSITNEPLVFITDAVRSKYTGT